MAKHPNASDGIARARQGTITASLGDDLPSPDQFTLHVRLVRIRDLNLFLITGIRAVHPPRIPIRR